MDVVVSPRGLSDGERRHLARVRRRRALATAPGVAVLILLGGLMSGGAAVVAFEPAPDWTVVVGGVFGMVFVGFGLAAAWAQMREWRALKAAERAGVAVEIDDAIPLPETSVAGQAILAALVPHLLRRLVGARYAVAFPASAWSRLIDDAPRRYRGVATKRFFYLLDAPPLSVAQDVERGLLAWRELGGWIIAVAALAIVAAGFLLDPEASVEARFAAPALAAVVGAIGYRVFEMRRANRRYLLHLARSAPPSPALDASAT